MTAHLLRLTIAVLLGAVSLAAQERPSNRVEVIVLGSMHLQQRDHSASPVNVAGVRHTIRAFAPDAVVRCDDVLLGRLCFETSEEVNDV